MGYSLSDSATVWRQETRAAYAGGGYAAALDFDLGKGEHVFRGLTRKDGTLYPFSWQRGKQADYAVRADVSVDMRGARRAPGRRPASRNTMPCGRTALTGIGSGTATGWWIPTREACWGCSAGKPG